MRKQPRKSNLLVNIGKGVLVVEFAALCVAYYYWRKMNHSQAYRYQLSKEHPNILAGYYKVGEYLDSKNSVRLYDKRCWGIDSE
ncbi:protein CEBPZOS-like [Tubulanus polymorphus]|uniref:protein CEBPZOS-like n=1 Tax=Tubulanus polymorphus TaxID=672921 RepID=UPI003DA2792A